MTSPLLAGGFPPSLWEGKKPSAAGDELYEALERRRRPVQVEDHGGRSIRWALGHPGPRRRGPAPSVYTVRIAPILPKALPEWPASQLDGGLRRTERARFLLRVLFPLLLGGSARPEEGGHFGP